MVVDFTSKRILPDDLATRAYLLGINYERAKFLASCPHTENMKFRKTSQIVIVPFNEQIQIDEAKRIGIGAKDASDMFEKPVEVFLEQNFPMKSLFPKTSKYGGYSLFQPYDHQEVTRYLKSRNKYQK